MNARGFTLIELLVAVAILVTMTALAYGGLNTMIAQYHNADAEIERLGAVQRTMLLLSSDMRQVQPRPIREQYHGDRAPAFTGGPGAEYAVELTRGGWSNPARHRRATLQRAAWRLYGNRIERVHWQMLDRAQQQQPVVTPLLDGVERFEWRFMDSAREWHDAWPPAAAQLAPEALPRAAELSLVLENGDEIRRLFVLRAD